MLINIGRERSNQNEIYEIIEANYSIIMITLITYSRDLLTTNEVPYR